MKMRQQTIAGNTLCGLLIYLATCTTGWAATLPLQHLPAAKPLLDASDTERYSYHGLQLELPVTVLRHYSALAEGGRLLDLKHGRRMLSQSGHQYQLHTKDNKILIRISKVDGSKIDSKALVQRLSLIG